MFEIFCFGFHVNVAYVFGQSAGRHAAVVAGVEEGERLGNNNDPTRIERCNSMLPKARPVLEFWYDGNEIVPTGETISRVAHDAT